MRIANYPDSDRVEMGKRSGVFLEEVTWPAGYIRFTQVKGSKTVLWTKGRAGAKTQRIEEQDQKKKGSQRSSAWLGSERGKGRMDRGGK